MSFGGRANGQGTYISGADDPKSNGYCTGSYYQSSIYAIRNSGPVPAYSEPMSRRRSMNIEDMLNPSEESTRQEQQPQSPRSYKAGKPSRPGSSSHRAKVSARSQGGPRPTPRGKGLGSPDIPPRTRAFRPGYTDEQELFIWYLRIDCGYSWTAIAEAYNARFSQDGEGQRRIPGLQCKFYRITEANGLPHVRAMRRTRDTVQRCGMRAITGYTREDWSWLDGRYPVSGAYGHNFG